MQQRVHAASIRDFEFSRFWLLLPKDETSSTILFPDSLRLPGRGASSCRQGAAEPLSCADRSVTASAVHTPEDVKAFVQCAYEFVQEMGFEEARRAFNEDERWKSGPIYIFVSEATPMSDQARLFVFPPARSREGSSLGLLIDAFGNDYYKEQHRIVSSFGAGWLYYSLHKSGDWPG